LLSSSLCGVDTHGIQHLPSNVAWLRSGEIVGTAWPEVTKESPSSALVKGNWTFGHVTAKVVMDVAIAKAEQQGIAIVGAVELNHVGRLGEYAEMAAAKGMVA